MPKENAMTQASSAAESPHGPPVAQPPQDGICGRARESDRARRHHRQGEPHIRQLFRHVSAAAASETGLALFLRFVTPFIHHLRGAAVQQEILVSLTDGVVIEVGSPYE